MKSGEAIALVLLVVIGGAAVFLALKAKGAAPVTPQKPGFQATVGSAINKLPAPVRTTINATTNVTRTGYEKVGEWTHTGKTGEWATRIATFPVLGPLSLL